MTNSRGLQGAHSAESKNSYTGVESGCRGVPLNAEPIHWAASEVDLPNRGPSELSEGEVNAVAIG